MTFPDSDLGITILAYLGADPTDDSSNWPTPVDLSARLQKAPITTTVGRRTGQDTLSSGSCTFELLNTAIGDGLDENAAGVLTPLNPNSPYYSIWDLGAPMALDVSGVGASPPYARFRGYVASIEPRYLPGNGGADWSTVKVTLAGEVQRLGRGSTPMSDLRRWTASQTLPPAAYWPIDHGEPSALDQAEAAIGGMPLVLDYAAGTGTASWSAAELAPWLGPGLLVDGGLSLSGPAPAGATVTEAVAADVLLRNGLPRGTTGALSLQLFDAATAGGATYLYQLIGTLSSFSTGLFLYRQTGATLDPFGAGTDEQADAVWDDRLRHLRVMAVQVGSDVEVSAYLDGELVASGTHSSATLGVPSWQLVMTGTPQAALGHAMLWSGDAADIPPAADVWTAALGHAGEQAHVRMARVCAEEGIPFTSTATDSVACGPQPFGDVLAVLRDAEAVDRGVLTELVTDWGLGYVSGSQRMNRNAAMTVDLATYRVSAGKSGDVLTPVRNDQRLRNEWTISRPNGSSATVRDADSQSKHGRYDDSATVNTESDDDPIHQANWRLHESTYPNLRYRLVPLDLAANTNGAPADLLADWLEVGIGDRIDRTNPPAGYTEEHLQLLGYSETLTRRSWQVTTVTEPYDIWAVGVLGEDNPADDADAELVGRWDGDDECAIRAAIDADDTTIAFDPNTCRWSVTHVKDDFDRTEGSSWGTPPTGPAWTTASAAGGDPSVAGGLGVITLDTANASTVIEATGISAADVQILARGLSPASTPTGDQATNGFYLRSSADYSTTYVWSSVEWQTDGTATLLIITSADGVLAAETVPGVTGSAAVDMLILARGSRLDVWVAPSATGLDLSDAPLVSVTTTVTAAGRVAATAFADASLSVPLAMRFSEIGISSPGSFSDDFPMPARLVPSPAAPTSGGELVEISQITTTPAAFVAAGTAAHANNSAASPGNYAGGAVGDWVVVYAGERDTGGMTLAISDPNYTYDFMGQQGGLYVWAAVRTATNPAPTVTPTGGGTGDTVSAQVFGLRNMPITLSPSNYIIDSAGLTNASAQNMAYPGLPAGEVWGRIVLLFGRKSDDWTSVAATGWTEIGEPSSTTGDDQGIWAGYVVHEGPTHVPNGSITVTGGASAVSDTLLIALAGGYQTATVVRSKNGIEKAHAAGTRLRKENPLIWAL